MTNENINKCHYTSMKQWWPLSAAHQPLLARKRHPTRKMTAVQMDPLSGEGSRKDSRLSSFLVLWRGWGVRGPSACRQKVRKVMSELHTAGSR